ncbi:MAG: hypothetical protein IT303_16900 [Dehalococcoidia bacterium]|nr:hypothetical protein [Dehalococcoidia bacterium]
MILGAAEPVLRDYGFATWRRRCGLPRGMILGAAEPMLRDYGFATWRRRCAGYRGA